MFQFRCLCCLLLHQVNLPQVLLNFVIKNLAGVILYFFQKQVMKVAANPDCAHGVRIRQNREFYEQWLLPKIRWVIRYTAATASLNSYQQSLIFILFLRK
jgi:hypothetical protein